jgi:hypothetical protein
MRILIEYTQKFNGKRLKDTYERFVANEREADDCLRRLYEDPHVTGATWVELEDKQVGNV